MSKIKKALIEKSNKQEIHNLSEKIVSSVDTDKVIYTQAKSSSWFKPFMKVAVPCLVFTASAVLITVAVMRTAGPDVPSRHNGKAPSFTQPIVSSSSSTSSSAASSSEEDNLIEIDSDNVVLDTYAKEVTSLMDIVLSFNDITFVEPTLDLDTNRMTESEEKYLVSDLSAYMDSLEGMLGINTLSFKYEYNNNSKYDYEYLLTVSISDTKSYYVYYNDVITNEKNVGKDNYKVDSDLTGVVVYNDSEYSLSGSKRVENGSQEFNMKIETGDKYISVREDLSSTNYFRYEYYDMNDNLLKFVDIEQKETEIDFQNAYDKTVLKLNSDNTINCKIKSRESDRLTILEENGVYTYTFKNSKNVYTVENGNISC